MLGIEWYVIILGVFITLGMVGFMYFTVTIIWWLIDKIGKT